MKHAFTRPAAWLAPWIVAYVFSAALVIAINMSITGPVQAETTAPCISQHDDPMLTYAITTHRVPERLGGTCFGG